MSQKQIDKEEQKIAEAIVRKESENAAAFLEHELKQEVAVINSHSTTPIRVVVIGGNESYYRSTLTKLRDIYPDVEFVKFIGAGGNNAFFAIDSLDPDIILIAHNAPMQNAVKFFEAVQTQNDQHGLPYAEKYKDKRIIVMAPNDYQYAIELHNCGIKYMIPLLDSRIYSVNADTLMKIIHEAYNDILEVKHQREIGFNIPADALMASASAKDGGMTEFYRVNNNKRENIASREPSSARGTQKLEYGSNYLGYYGCMEDEQTMAPHKIIGIYSGTGGAGTTMFATNLASILSKYTKDEGTDYRVCLVEYNLACRNVDVFFNLKFSKQSKKSVTSIAQDAYAMYYDKNKETIVAGAREMVPLISRYTEHIPSIGLDIIPGIAVPLEIDNLSTGFSTALFTTLRQMYDVVIVDLSADVAKMPMLETMNEIDDFYYIMPMDVPSIRNAKVLIKFLTGYFKKAPEEIKVIMNKVDPENEKFGIEQVTDILIQKGQENCTPEGTIPYEPKDVSESINQGTPISMSHPEHPVSQAIFSIALGINPMLNMSVLEQKDKEQKQSSGGFWKNLFSGGKKPKSEEKNDKKKAVFNNKKKKKLLDVSTSKEQTSTLPVDAPTDKTDNLDEKPKRGFFNHFFGYRDKKKTKMASQNK